MPIYTQPQRVSFREYMGLSLLFASGNAIFENVLNTIQSLQDDGATFNETLVLLGYLQNIDQLRLQNASLGFATISSTGTNVDAARNDAILKSVGRTYINRLSIIFSMKPTRDYYNAAPMDPGGDVVIHDYGK
jgi:hypothetical protein